MLAPPPEHPYNVRMMNVNTESNMGKQQGVYKVGYHWQDGYGIWHLEFVNVIADHDEHAMEVAQATVDMPYGPNEAYYCGYA